MNIAILVPTYNEAKNISLLLRMLADSCKPHTNTRIEVFVIDDNSRDGTSNIVKSSAIELNTSNFWINTIHRARKEGLGKAYIHGFKYVLELNRFDYVLQMDADLSHSPHYLNDFFEAARRGSDFIVASRYLRGGGIPDWTLHRRLLSKFGNMYARILLGNKVSDYTGGFNMYATSLLKQINLDALKSPGYGFLISLKYHAVQHAKMIVQFPIIFVDRTAGESKMPLNTIVNNFYLVFDLWRTK